MNINQKYTAPSHFSTEEKSIWQVLMYNDFVAFCTQDWSIIADDFIKENFFGIDGKLSSNKMNWSLTYNSLEAYQKDWIQQSIDFNKKTFLENPLDVLFKTTKLSKIEIIDNSALVHKEFNGTFLLKDEKPIELNWISLFVLRKVNENWKIASFTGYLPK